MHLHIFFLKYKFIGFQYDNDMAYCRLNRTIFFPLYFEHKSYNFIFVDFRESC
jgi:hypothetical protein